MPAQRVHARHIQQLFRRAVGLARIKYDVAAKADSFTHPFGQFLDGEIHARTDIDQRRQRAVAVIQYALEPCIVEIHQEYAGIGHVVAVEKLAIRCAGPPHHHFLITTHFGFVELADERGDDMGSVEVVVVARAIQVGRHHGQKLGAVLAVERPAHFDTGDLGHGVGTIGGFERAGEEVFLLHRLRAVARVDARGTEKQQAFDAVPVCRLDEVVLDREVDGDEVSRIGVVGEDAADFGGSKEHVVGFFCGEEGFDRGLAGEVELSMGAGEDVCVSGGSQTAGDGRTDQAAMAGDVDFRVFVHGVTHGH
jgi:hypothetical protein